MKRKRSHARLFLVIAWACLGVSAVMFALNMTTDLSSVHDIHHPYPMAIVQLPPGKYDIYQDPGSSYFPASGRDFSVRGSSGSLRIVTDNEFIPLSSFFMGMGAFTPVGQFTVNMDARYVLRPKYPESELYVARVSDQVELGLCPWIVLMVLSLGSIGVSALARRAQARNLIN